MNTEDTPALNKRLIELLVIVVVVALLAAILIPPIRDVFSRHHPGRPGAAVIHEIHYACANCLNRAGKLPTTVEPRPNRDLPPDEARSREVMRTLAQMGEDGTRLVDRLNVAADGTLLDPWGRQYLIIFDDNGDGIFPYGPGVRFGTNKVVLVVSRGPNRRLDGPGGDDVLPARPQVEPIR